jgi:hypothetical protein
MNWLAYKIIMLAPLWLISSRVGRWLLPMAGSWEYRNLPSADDVRGIMSTDQQKEPEA